MAFTVSVGEADFAALRNENAYYVDKTEMIHYLNSVINTQQRFVSVSRPRRFGKTMAADMICAYYGREASEKTAELCSRGLMS